MATLEQRGAIFFLSRKGLKLSEIVSEMKSVYGESCPTESTIKKWNKDFKCGRDTIEDAPRAGRPQELDIDRLSQQIYAAIKVDRRITIEQISSELRVSYGTVQKILSDELGLKKRSLTFVPHSLRFEEKQKRVEFAQQNLSLYNKHPEDFINHLQTMDESWVYHYDPECKSESKEWSGGNLPESEVVASKRSSKKLMLCCFWNSKGIVRNFWLETGTTLNSRVYISQVQEILDEILENRPRGSKKTLLWLHDNARPHVSHETMEFFAGKPVKLLPHPPYSPDLAPSDYFLFAHLKKHLRGKHFKTDSEVKEAVKQFFDSKPPDFYERGIRMLIEKYQRVIASKGEYFQ